MQRTRREKQEREQADGLGVLVCSGGEDGDIFPSINTQKSQSRVVLVVLLLLSQLSAPATQAPDTLPCPSCWEWGNKLQYSITQFSRTATHVSLCAYFYASSTCFPYQARRERAAIARGPWLCRQLYNAKIKNKVSEVFWLLQASSESPE